MSASSSNAPRAESEEIVKLRQQLYLAELKIQVLEEKLRLQQIKKYGPGSEKLASGQLALLDLEPGVSDEEVQAESRREPVAEKPAAQQRRKHPGRQELPAHLPRVEKVIPCPPERCSCGACGKAMAVIGYEQSEHLDVKPPSYFVVVTKREKRACRACGEGGVAAAPAPERIIGKGLVSDGIVIDTVVAKYCDHLPLYRQSAMLERETGLELSRGTLDGWVMRVGELLTPMAGAMGRELLSGTYIQADETPVGVQTHNGRGRNHQAYLWQYGRPGASVVFDFRMGRAREGPKKFLGDYEGILQTDGYTAYDGVGGPRIVHAACWAHARRKYTDALKLNPRDEAALRMTQLMNGLFAMDAEARRRGLTQAERHAMRLEQAPALVEKIQAEAEAGLRRGLPAGALSKAAQYTLSLWNKLTRFLEHPELELSNNLAENSMRPVAVGRKNWIHIGSEKAGPKVAAILSVVESCKRLRIPVREYLGSVLPTLAGTSIQRLGELTPAAWQARHA